VQPSFVVMSGLPASGKSTLGRRLSVAFGLPMIDKDDLLEQRFDSETLVLPAERARLSRLADVDFERAGLASRGAVLVSFWRRTEVSTTSGTPTEWLTSLPDVVEVHCACSPATAAARFLARSRHVGHGDDRASASALLGQFQALDRLGPLGLTPVVVVDCETQPDVASVLDAVRSLR
jgi:gluconate kinase